MTLGDKGKEVSQLQKYLSMLGYDLVIDGNFEIKTLRSLKAFQKKYALLVDGIADSETFSALKAAQKRTSKEEGSRNKKYTGLLVDIEHNLSSEQYIKQIFEKDKVFIYHTVSGSDARKLIKYWDGDSPRISTAFVISGRECDDGKIYEAHNPDYWSYHLGVKGTKGKLDKHSIGIGICAWGALEKKDDKYYNIYGTQIPEKEVYKLKDKFRGNKYFHMPSDNQIKSLEDLLLWVVKEYKIPIQNINFDKDWIEYSDELIKEKKPGIWTHTNVRKDKVNMYPDHRIFKILNTVKSKINNND